MNTDKKITTNGGVMSCQPAPQGFPSAQFPFAQAQPQCVSPHVVPSQPDLRANKLNSLEVTMSYSEKEFTRPLKKINGDGVVEEKTLMDYFLEAGINDFSSIYKVSLLEILKIDAALMKDGYYPFFIDCYNKKFTSAFEEIQVVLEFCKYQLALVQKYETDEVSKVLNERLEELLLGDSSESLNSLTMKNKNGLIFWMSNFVPKVSENKFLSKLFEFNETVSDYINIKSKENDDDFDFFEHVIEVSDCVVRFTFLSEVNVMISLEKAGETISFYTIKIDGNDILVERDNEGE